MKEIIQKFKGKKVLVIGDLMLDKLIFGDVERISPEAPVQVVNVKKETFVPGGAANTANNVVSLGGIAHLSGILGNDDSMKILVKEFDKRKINHEFSVIDDLRPTTKKVRIVARSQQLVRVDYEDDKTIDEFIEKKLKEKIKQIISNVDAVIISDYSKGLNSEEFMQFVINLAKENKKPVIVDSKSRNYNIFKNATVITPSHLDAARITNLPMENEEDVVKIGKLLQDSLNCNVLMTRGAHGMTIFEKNSITHIPTKAREVYDVTGAGDTVVAALTLALCSGASLKEAAEIATHAAAVVIGKVGTATVSIEELEEDIKRN